MALVMYLYVTGFFFFEILFLGLFFVLPFFYAICLGNNNSLGFFACFVDVYVCHKTKTKDTRKQIHGIKNKTKQDPTSLIITITLEKEGSQ